jgi:ABC-type glycerol-3-phosphate transport system permease component
MLVLLGPIFVSMAFGMNAVAIEGRGAVAAFGGGFGRIFNRKEFWRAVLFSICAFAINVIGSMLIGAVAFAFVFLKSVAIEVVATSLLNAAFAPFSVVLIAVYYFDVRIRHEAFDLESELERLSAGPLVA